MERRDAAAEETRTRIVMAARELLSGDIGGFTVNAVAARAGVARMTVYYQFGSKTGLIEAVFDTLEIVKRGVPRLVAALSLQIPEETLQEFVSVFADVWQADRLVIRRLQGLAALDPEFAKVWYAREGQRRAGMEKIATRVAERMHPSMIDVEAATSAMYAIASPEAFEAIAGPHREFGDVAPLVLQLLRKALALDGGEPLSLPPGRKPKDAATTRVDSA